MVLLINVLQAIKRNVRVNLRSRNISVAQDGLDGSEICAIMPAQNKKEVVECAKYGARK